MWWRLSLKPFRHAAGGSSTVLEILITGLDITSKMTLTRELEVSTSRFRSVVNAAYDAIITIDQAHNITLFNRAAENLFGYDASEVLGKPLVNLLPEAYRANHPSHIHQFARSPVHSRQMDERNRIYGQHRDGSLLPVEIAISKINVDGLLEFTAVIRDISDRVRLMDLLQKEAGTDELTGLPNRREFLDVVENVLRTDDRLSMLMLDIDYFKKVNDTYGHDAGDEVLRVLAKVGTAASRNMDVFARWGGEEFVVAMPGTEMEQARARAEMLRTTIEKQEFPNNWSAGKAIPFTVSIGVGDAGVRRARPRRNPEARRPGPVQGKGRGPQSRGDGAGLQGPGVIRSRLNPRRIALHHKPFPMSRPAHCRHEADRGWHPVTIARNAVPRAAARTDCPGRYRNHARTASQARLDP